MIGDDLKLDESAGVCGKDGQSAPVGVGQPMLKIDAMTVGGTASQVTARPYSHAVGAARRQIENVASMPTVACRPARQSGCEPFV